MIVQFRNEKVSNHGSIPITIDCNVVAFIVFEEGFHQPVKRTKQLRSSDCAGQLSKVMPLSCSSNHLQTMPVVWKTALSCRQYPSLEGYTIIITENVFDLR
ncbi:hypothetical protein TNCV_2987461 [Trichonephila clavipes]|nr:hypothetical protein TNCV_2987461 [Trichonephila clavipes]